MSSRGSPIPKELEDGPANPFLPFVPPLAALRTRIARRRPTLPHTTASAPTHFPSIPFGEIGRENDDDFDVMSVLSGGVSDLDVDAESAAFQPRVRNLQTRRPIVRRRMTADVAAAGTREVGDPRVQTAKRSEGTSQDASEQTRSDAPLPAKGTAVASPPEEADEPRELVVRVSQTQQWDPSVDDGQVSGPPL
ncbi:hypothetical protein BMF94_4621 [Rhodotorula taiwanensis]|uniref:Uncharacterized protein n=1 Tax=Rhodotorula taiwanensis TaxID=741276 RepID=A0A2S5B6C4_9BASI|nr:hypothetical protein BMF94_4621 [Rhodotorula taiwanensis]